MGICTAITLRQRLSKGRMLAVRDDLSEIPPKPLSGPTCPSSWVPALCVHGHLLAPQCGDRYTDSSLGTRDVSKAFVHLWWYE